jgi:hypothetical protein
VVESFVSESSQEASVPFERAYAEGCQLFQQGQCEAAIEAYNRAAILRPHDFRPWEMTACCLGALCRWEDCLAAFERARQLGHECNQCWYNRSLALCRLSRADEALQALDRSLALEPNNPAAWFDRGRILGLAYGRAAGELEPFDGRHERAVAAFDQVIALQPNHYGAWYCKAYTLYVISHSWSATQGLIAAGARRVKLLSPTANAPADETCGIIAIGPFRRLTARLPGPKLCLSPQPHRVRHELRPPALATPARHPGSGRPPRSADFPIATPRRVKLLSLTAIGPVDGACGSLAIGRLGV